MTKKCWMCGEKIDTGHDEHYYCKQEVHYLAVCTTCYMKQSTCDECSKKMQFKEESITKKAYFNPSTRNPYQLQYMKWLK